MCRDPTWNLSSPPEPAQPAHLVGAARGILDYPFRVELVYPEEITKTAGGKPEEFMRELPDTG